MHIHILHIFFFILSLHVIIQAIKPNNVETDTPSYEDSEMYTSLNSELDYDEPVANEQTEEQYRDEDEDIYVKEGPTTEKLLVGNHAGNPNKVNVTPRGPSKYFEWVDEWSGCKCGKGQPGGIPQTRKKKRLLKIVSGYAPHR